MALSVSVGVRKKVLWDPVCRWLIRDGSVVVVYSLSLVRSLVVRFSIYPQ